MKKFTLITCLVIAACTVNAQWELWTESELITDTLSFNSSPSIIVFETQAYLFYEKKYEVDEPTKIVYRDVKNMGPEFELYGEEEITYRNPQVLPDLYGSSDHFLYFESDQSGNFELYIALFDGFMNFENPIQLTFTSEDVGNTKLSYWDNDISWDAGGSVFTAELLVQTDTVLLNNLFEIDSMECSIPSLISNKFYFQKLVNGLNQIYRSQFNYSSGEWEVAVAVDETGDNTYLHSAMDAWGYMWDDGIVYEKEGEIINYYNDEIYELDLENFEGSCHQPHSVFYTVPVDYLPTPMFLTFQSDATGQQDIYAMFTEDWGMEQTNLSDDLLENSNPRLLWGWYAGNPCSQWLLDIWETTTVSGFQAFYMSKTSVYVCGSTNDQSLDNKNLKVSPNPFSYGTTVSYNSNSSAPITLEVLNSTGQAVVKQYKTATGPGWLDFDLVLSSDIPGGILYIRLSQGDRQLFRKVIYK